MNWIDILEKRATPNGTHLSGPEATMLSDYITNNLKDTNQAKYLLGVILRDITPKGLTLSQDDTIIVLESLDNLTDA